eukprot:4774118-Prymnesium_polylepis.1
MIPSAPSVHSARKSPGAHRFCGHPERARHAHPPQARTRDESRTAPAPAGVPRSVGLPICAPLL